MNALKSFFDAVSGWYGEAFGEWLNIHFGIRTLILLLCVWAAVFLLAQIIKYLIGPLLILIFYHVFFRAWNFIFVETFQEWIYIHYYSREKPFLSKTYLKLCDKIKSNRLKLEYTRYKGILMNGGTSRTAHHLMIILLIVGTLWVSAFGLYFEYAYEPAPPGTDLVNGANGTAASGGGNNGSPEDGLVNGGLANGGSFDGATPVPGLPSPTPRPQIPTPPPTAQPDYDLFWLASDYLYLNEYGFDGANVRDMPDGLNSIVLEVVWGDARLENLGVYYEDATNPGMFWIKVITEAGTEGYISSRLMSTEEV